MKPFLKILFFCREDVATSTEFKKEPESDDMFGQEYDECGNLLPPPMELPTTAPPTGVMSTAAEATNRKDKGAVPALDSASFWRSCNVAGCTQAIFEDLIMEISNISTRIQSHQASQEDYDTALKVIMASGKLPKLVKKQQNALRGKQIELQRSLEAMQDVESVLRR
ncbi:uncharacterized protein phf11 isoform X2 [Nerophis ophidion]|uniref:uncharacterized protein phf11 isoform X2 n=1 Tax=Nerophis ophidion TaxID=159077 RepID=UPI002ADF8309|nr:uncharacterized protein phf11 isoform X2 [Nerophis ophidion]